MPELRFGLLGALEVFVDGIARPVPPGRQRAVLTCLLVHAGHPAPADALIEAAWDGQLPQDPARALRTVLSRVRATVGRDAIVREPGGYQLRECRTDAAEFERLLEQSRGLEPHAAAELLGRALDLWRGPAYGEYAEAPFAQAAGARLRRLRWDAVEAYASARLACGEPGAVVEVLEDLLEQEPFREYAVELLVTALYQAGRQTEALARLRAHRRELATELGLDPAPSLVSLEARILGHTLPSSEDDVGAPAWLDTSTAFLGREEELADLMRVVPANRLTVVTGPGGVGKSRLVAEALPALAARCALPVSVIELVPVARGQVLMSVADRLGLRAGEQPGSADTDDLLEVLAEYLVAAPRLLVLDNCEHLRGEVAALCTVLIRRCRTVRVLATSRRRIGIPTEQVLPLVPLEVPDPHAATGRQTAAASVRLFTDRVRRLRPRFGLTAANTAEVGALCRRCDGLPLAVELAASRAATSGVSGVLERFPVDVLAGPGGLAAVVSWSYDLLTPEQQWVLDTLSVFSGDFSQQAVTGVLSRLPDWSGQPARALAELVESCLVVHQDGPSGSRFRLLEMVRSFAQHRLAATGREAPVRHAHAAWVRQTVTRIHADWARVDGADLAARLNACEAEISSALRWGLTDGDVVVAAQICGQVGLCLHWTPGQHLRTVMIQVGRAVAPHASPEVASGVAAAAFALGERGDPAGAHRLATIALGVADDEDAASLATLTLAVAAMYTGDHAASARWFRRLARQPGFVGEANASLALLAAYAGHVTLARQHAEVALVASATDSAATAAFAQYAAGEVAALDDPPGAIRLFTAAAQAAEQVQAEQVSRVSRVALFALLVRQRRHQDAVALGRRLCADLRRWGAWTQVWTLVRMLAELHADQGRWSEAAFLLGAAQAAPGAPPPVGADQQRYAELTVQLRRHLGDSVLDQIQRLAAGTPRSQVLGRAEQTLRNPVWATARSGVGKP